MRITDSLAEQPEVRIGLLCQSFQDDPEVFSSNPSVLRSVPTTRSRISLNLGLPLRRALMDMIDARKTDLLHNHGLWLPANHWTARLARRKQIPFVTHTRGMLKPWAMSHRRWKKQLALRLYQGFDLKNAALFFVTADQEVAAVRQLCLRQPIAVIPNGVDLPNEHKVIKANNPQQRRVLFLGRIHPIKGLTNLINAWAQVRAKGWILHLAGPDEGGYLAEVMGQVRELGLSKSVKVISMNGYPILSGDLHTFSGIAGEISACSGIFVSGNHLSTWAVSMVNTRRCCSIRRILSYFRASAKTLVLSWLKP